MWVHVTHLLSLCDPMTFTYSHSVCDDLISWNWTHSWKNSGDLIWKPNSFQVFSCAGFSSVFLFRYVERVRGVVDTSHATMVNSPGKKDVSWDMFWLGNSRRHFQKSYKSPSEIRGSKMWLHSTTYHKSDPTLVASDTARATTKWILPSVSKFLHKTTAFSAMRK